MNALGKILAAVLINLGAAALSFAACVVDNNFHQADNCGSVDVYASAGAYSTKDGAQTWWQNQMDVNSNWQPSTYNPCGGYTGNCGVLVLERNTEYHHDLRLYWYDADPDDDGVNDVSDPYPGSSDPFTYQVVQEQYDANGKLIYMAIKTDQGDLFEYGTANHDDQQNPVYTLINSPWKDSTELGHDVGIGADLEGAAANVNNDVDKVAASNIPDETYEAGENNNATNTVETDYLKDTVKNTAAIANNTATMGDQLENLGAAIQEGTTYLTGMLEKDVSGGGVSGDGGDYPTAEEIGQEVGQRIHDETGAAAEQSSNQAIIDGMASTAQGFIDQISDTSGNTLENAPEEYRQKKNIGTEFDSILGGNNALNAITDTTASFSGDCKFTHNLFGQTVEFTMCNYAPELAGWGVVLQMIAGLHALLIVFKR